jgi:hypothetical protein
MAASTKVQLGARVSPGVREAAVARAKSEGVSLNVWVERTLGAALAGPDPILASALAPSADVPAPRRAPDDGPNLRAAYAMDRQAKLNAAKYGRKS